MATITAQAKLYTGIRCLCVDKNISAALTSSFSIGNYNRPIQPAELFVLSSGALVQRLKRTVADVECVASITLTNERYKTYGGANNVITAGSPRVVNNARNWKMLSSVVCDFPTYIEIDVEKLGIPEGTDVILNFEEGWLLEDRGRRLPSGAWEYPNAVQGSLSPKQDNFVSFRTPKFGLSFMNSILSYSLLDTKFRPFSATLTDAFTPVVNVKLTRGGVIDLQSAFVAVIQAGEIVRLLSRADLFVVAGPMGPGATPYLEGNGFPYYDINGNLTGLGIFPGITRIRQSTATFDNASTAVLSAEVINLPFIWTLENISSEFTMVSQLDAFKGVGTPNLSATSSLSCSATVNYNSVIPTMQATSTVFARTPLQAQATLTATTSVSATQGAPLTLTWFAIDPGLTTGILFKGPNINVTIKWSDGVIDTVSGGTPNGNVADAPITNYYTRTHTAVDYITAEISGSLSGFQFSKNGVDTTNGTIDGDDRTQTIYAGTWFVAGRQRLVSCSNWGDVGLTNLNGAFANCVNLQTVPTFLPKVPTGTNLPMACAFLNNFTLNSPNLIGWNTSQINTMAGMFKGALQMRQPITNWNTSSVTNMRSMFSMVIHSGGFVGYPVSYPNTTTLNWNVTNVSRANMTSMFEGHSGANLQLSSWCVSHITTMPTNFTYQTTTNWPTARRPQWGTCP